MTRRAGIRAVATALPMAVRTNAYYRERYADRVAAAEASTLARIWSPPEGGASLFDQAMVPYVADPFRGAVERRVLAPGETGGALQLRAARAALAAIDLPPARLDLLISCAFFPDLFDVGNAASLAGELGVGGTAWNLETACSSALVAVDTAAALVEAGRHETVLVTTACTYSTVSDEEDSLSWFLGDGGGAFVVGPTDDGSGILASHAIHTAQTCGAFFQEITVERGRARRRMLAGKSTGKVLRDTAEPFVRACCEGALARAGVAARDIALFVFNTPTAWYAAFCARALGVSEDRTLNLYPRYANIGPALFPVTLHHAAAEGRIARGNLVLAYSVGSASSAAATVMRWGEVAVAAG